MTSTWHVLSEERLEQQFQSDIDTGLTASEARQRFAAEGPNELPEAPPASWFKLLLAQFTSLLIWVLIGAAALSGLLGEWLDAAAILAIVFLNGVFGFVQEFRAERSLAALRRLSVATARVIREGVPQSIAARDLVPGDVILLEAGDRIPADARLFYTTAFQTQEASLTGESTAVQKESAVLQRPDVPLADRDNMVFMGTTVVSGKARAMVVATALKTELGRISSLIQAEQAAERAETPLQRRLEQFAYTLLWLALAVIAVVFVLGYLRGESVVDMFLTSVSLAVAAVPEGLPAVVTITLALGVTRMVRRHALIRKLPAVETLGSATVICTDKTGTLTKNEMTVTKLFVDGRLFEVTGEGFQLTGSIPGALGLARDAPDLTSHPFDVPFGVQQLLIAGVLCNGATLQREDGLVKVLGDPTEGALLVAAAKTALTKENLEREAAFECEIPFDGDRKMMSIIRHTPRGRKLYAKGAPDVLLSRCTHYLTLDGRTEPLNERDRSAVLRANASLAHETLRVLAAASRSVDGRQDASPAQRIETGLVFLGLFAMKDPLRPEAAKAVARCHQAGVLTVMITGDHKETAVAIARELGLETGDRGALSGAELDELTDQQLADSVERVSVFARVSAEHKLRIIKAWKSRGAIVAMTGDGVNDAPAVKAADIGVAMGIAGTDVTKEAADMVVTDDNFASIAAAVEEGRGVFDNIRKTVHFLLSCNASEVLVMLFAALFNLPLPLLPIQILWMNFITDGIPALALAADPKAPDLMARPPRPPDAPLLDGRRLLAIGGEGLMLSSIALGVFSYSLIGLGEDLDHARTVLFTGMVVAQLVHAFNCRSERLSLFEPGVQTNSALWGAFIVSSAIQLAVLTLPAAAPIFKVTALSPTDWLLIGAMAVLPLVLVEATKALRRNNKIHRC